MKRNHLGKLIADRRGAIDMTQVDLAKALGMETAVSVCRWEKGVSPVPWIHFRNLSKVLDVPMQAILNAARADSPSSVEQYQAAEKRLAVKPVTKGVLTLRPDLADALDELLEQYPHATLQGLVESFVEYGLDRSRFGLDANYRPITLAEQDRKALAGKSKVSRHS